MAPLSDAQLARRKTKLTGQYNPVRQAAYQARQTNLGIPNIPSAITSANLAIPTAPISLPNTPVQTAGTGLQGYIETLTANARKAAETSQNDYQSAISDYLGKGNEQLKLEDKGGIDEKTKKANDLTSQLEAEQLALVRQKEKIEKNTAGLYGGAVAQEVNRVERESLSKQADLAILQNAANRDLATAQSIIDRKIELKYEPMKEKIGFLQEFNRTNQAALNDAEKSQLNNLIAQENRTYEDGVLQDKRAYEAYTVAAQNGAPDAVQQQILDAINQGDYQKATELTGPYLRDPGADLDMKIKQAQLAGLGVGGGFEMNATPAEDAEADAWVKNLQSKQANFSDIKSERMKSLVSQKLAGASNTGQKEIERAAYQDKINEIDKLINSPGMGTSVGPGSLARPTWLDFNVFTGNRSNFIAGVSQLSSRETLDNLLALKKAGGTLGAVNEREFATLENSATKINSWKLVDKNGKVYGYQTTQKAFIAELNKIKSITQRWLDETGFNQGSTDDYLDLIDGIINDPYSQAGYNLE